MIEYEKVDFDNFTNSLVSTEIVVIKPTLILDIVVVGSAGIFEVRVVVTESCYDN